MSGELFNNGGSYPPPNPMLSGSTSAGTKKKDSMGGGNGNGPNNKELHMFVWSSSASPISEGNLKHAVNKAASTDFGTVDPSKYVPHENTVASKGIKNDVTHQIHLCFSFIKTSFYII
jgi:auxin efflux carrier family protein